MKNDILQFTMSCPLTFGFVESLIKHALQKQITRTDKEAWQHRSEDVVGFTHFLPYVLAGQTEL